MNNPIRKSIRRIAAVMLALAAPARAADNPYFDLHNGTELTGAQGGTKNIRRPPIRVIRTPAENPCGGAADPVDVASGQFTTEETDVFLAGRMPVTVVRLYDSGTDYQGLFGRGWNLMYNERLFALDNGNLLLRADHVRKHEFVRQADGSFLGTAGRSGSVKQNPDGSYTLMEPNDTVRQFNPAGCLVEIRDGYGNQLLFRYAKEGKEPISAISSYSHISNAIVVARDFRLSRIEAAHNGKATGPAVDFEYDADGRVTRVKDSSGRSWTYAYDKQGHGELLSVTAPPAGSSGQGGTTRYTYSPEHQLVSIIRPDGTAKLVNTFDADGRITRQEAASAVYGFGYPDDGIRVTTNEYGLATERTLDSAGRVVKVVERGLQLRPSDPTARETRMTYDGAGRLTSLSGAAGRGVRMQYDANGNVTSVSSGPSNAPAADTKTYTYEARYNQPKTATAAGETVSYTYAYEDPAAPVQNGSLTSAQFISPDGKTSALSYAYNAYGQVSLFRDAAGVETAYEYDDASGHLTKVVRARNTAQACTNTFTYDKRGNLASETDPLGNQSTFDYDNLDRLTRITDPSGSSVEFAFGENGMLAAVKQATGDARNAWRQLDVGVSQDGRSLTSQSGKSWKSETLYDPASRRVESYENGVFVGACIHDGQRLPWKVLDAGSNTTEFSYTPDGQLQLVKDAAGNTMSYDFNDQGRLTAIRQADGSAEAMTYDANGRLASFTTRGGKTRQFTYAAGGMLQQKKASDGSVETFAFDCRGNLAGATGPSGSLARQYDPHGRISEETNSFGLKIGYSYDAAGNLAGLSYPGGMSLAYAYDAAGRVSGLKVGQQSVAQFAYDKLGRGTSVTYGNGVKADFAYDDGDSLVSLAWSGGSQAGPLPRFAYTLDNLANITGVKVEGGVGAGQLTYDYDTCGRLVSAKAPDGHPFPSETYRYDVVGNIVAIGGGRTEALSYNALNQVTNRGSVSCLHDADGNLTSNGRATFTYNEENQLVQAKLADGTTVSVSYDPLGRKIEEKVGDKVTRFLYDGLNLVAEADAAGKPVRMYIYAGGTDQLLAMTDDGGQTLRYFVRDHQGSVRAVTDAAGAVIEQYAYDAWGRVRAFDGAGQPIAKSAIGNRFLFQSREYNWDAGIYFFRTRWYDPELAQWMSPDPIGVLGGFNLYAFAFGNPILLTDPLGLVAWWQTEPSLTESLIPFYGSVRGAAYEWKRGNKGWAAFNAGFAVLDAFLIVKAGSAVVRGLGWGARQLEGAGTLVRTAAQTPAQQGWRTLAGGARYQQVGEVFIKEVNPAASRFAQWWGRNAIDEQVRGLIKLGEMAPEFVYKNGQLIIRDAGVHQGGWLKTYLQGSVKLGTFVNDIRPRNIGAAGQIFDPLMHPIQQGIYYLGGDAVAIVTRNGINVYVNPCP